MPHLDEVLEQVRDELRALRHSKNASAGGEERLGSRYVGSHADQSLVKHVASGGTVKTSSRAPTASAKRRGSAR